MRIDKLADDELQELSLKVSKELKKRSESNKLSATCQFCGKEFIKTHKGQIYCPMCRDRRYCINLMNVYLSDKYGCLHPHLASDHTSLVEFAELTGLKQTTLNVLLRNMLIPFTDTDERPNVSDLYNKIIDGELVNFRNLGKTRIDEVMKSLKKYKEMRF